MFGKKKKCNKISWVGSGWYTESFAYGFWLYIGDEPDYSLKTRIKFFESEEDFYKQEG